MDLTGKGLEIDLYDLPKCDIFKGNVQEQHDLLLVCCILSGCDYLESIKGIGFKKAVKLVQTYGDDIRLITQEIKKSGQNIQIESYIEEFSRAYLTFKHQVIFDSKTQCLVHLTPPDDEINKIDFVGNLNTDQNLVKLVCTGQLNPETHQAFSV